MAQQIKKLDAASVAKVRALEKKLGYCIIVVLEPQPKPADISPAQLKERQSLEKDMDCVLLAYTC